MAYSLTISTSQSENAAANQSTVNVTGTISSDSFSSYWGMSSSWGINIGGQGYGGAGPTALNKSSSWSFSASRTFTHDANGERGAVGTSCSFSVPGISYSGSTGGPTYGAINYDRKPATAGAVTAVVNPDKTITVSVASTTSPAGAPSFWLAYSTNGGTTWSTAVSAPGTNVPSTANYTHTRTYSGLTPGLNYRFRAYATNTDGTGGTTTMTSDVFLPSGGKIFNGLTFVPTTTAKIFTGSSWVDITTAKIYTGTTWANLQ